MKVGVGILAACLAVAALSASQSDDVAVQERARGAQQVVVGTAADVWSAFEQNRFGDRLIVSHATIDVEETMKGRAAPQVRFKFEGGTIGDLTLRVSDMPSLVRGQRAVLFLDQGATGEYELHGRHLGLMRLNTGNQVLGSNLTLGAVRTLVRQAGAASAWQGSQSDVSRVSVRAAAAFAVLAVIAARPQAFTTTSGTWPMSVVTVFVNPSNLDTDAASAESAIVAALDAWGSQSQASFRYVYGGRVNDTTTGNDGRNVMLFRNASNGAAIASTYTWWSGNALIDSIRSSGTVLSSSSAVVRAVGRCVHSGHRDPQAAWLALGLGHSTVPEATMYLVSGCSQEQRTLASDDIAGIESLYRASSTHSNSAPSLNDPQSFRFWKLQHIDGGDVVRGCERYRGRQPRIGDEWSSSAAGSLGTGGTLSVMLQPGHKPLRRRSPIREGSRPRSKQVST